MDGQNGGAAGSPAASVAASAPTPAHALPARSSEAASLPAMTSQPTSSAAQPARSPLPPTLSAPEKSLFPNSLPVRQSLPSIHSFGAGASHPPISQGPYGDSRARSSELDSKGTAPGRYGGSPLPYTTLPSLSNSGSPKLAAPTSAASQGAIHSSVSPRLPGLSQLSPPAPSSASLPTSGANTSSSTSYRNPMSVSSMLSGPSRDRPYGSVSSTATAPGTSPQPPVLPPAPTPIVGSQKHENGKAGSPPLPSIGGFRRPSEGASAMGSREAALKSIGQDKSTGADKSSVSSGVGQQAGADKDKEISRNSSASKTERSYPPLPTAFARESPYSTWANTPKKDLGFGARHDSTSSKESTPPASQSTQKPSGKSFFPSISSFSRPGSTPSTAAPHRHSPATSSQSSFPPTFPWTAATQQQQQQQQQAQQQQQQRQQQSSASSRAYPDFYHSTQSETHRAQEDKRKAETTSHHSHSQSTGQPTHSRQSSAQHHPTKSHVRYPGSDAYSSAASRSNPSTTSTHTNGAQDSWRQADSTSTALHGSSSDRHKRRRSEGVAGVRQEGGFADGKPKVVKPPFVPPFTLVDQRKASVRPPLLNVSSEAVVKALAEVGSAAKEGKATDAAPGKRPFLGRFVYDPFTDPASLLDGRLLASNLGGVVEVAISTGWFEPSPYLQSSTSPAELAPLPSTLFEVGDPATYDGSPMSDPSADETDPRIPPSVWELEGLRKRKVWGTDVYTDDSDVLALLLHSGWLRLGRRNAPSKQLLAGEKGAGEAAIKASRTPWKGFAGVEKDEKRPVEGIKSLIVKLIVAPRLVRYQGCERMGLKSRSWGNSHDGVSLMVESVEVVDGLLRPHGRRWTKRKLGDVVQSLLPAEVTAPPASVEVVLPTDEASKSLSVGDTFILGPRKMDCQFLKPPVENGVNAPEEADEMEVDE